MNPAVRLLLALACAGAGVLLYFAFEVLLFRFCCRLAGAPRPPFGRSVVIVLVGLLAVTAAEGLIGSVVVDAYIAANYPLWEAGFVAFFVGLPVHMIVASLIHAKMMGLRLAEGLAVWFVEKAIKLALLAFTAASAALVFLLFEALK